MSRQRAIFLTVVSSFFVTLSALGAGEVTVVLEPSHPPPYYTGEQLTLYVWLYSNASQDVRLSRVQLDFTQTDSAIQIVPPFVFEYPPDFPGGYEKQTLPPVVWESQTIECYCPEDFLPLPAAGSIRAGHIDVILPGAPGDYLLDVMNRNDPNFSEGARLIVWYTGLGPDWRAYTGNLISGSYLFSVLQAPQIPTISPVGVTLLMSLLFILGIVILLRGYRNPVSSAEMVAFALTLMQGNLASADPTVVPNNEVSLSVDSGSVSAIGSGSSPVQLYSHVISISNVLNLELVPNVVGGWWRLWS